MRNTSRIAVAIGLVAALLLPAFSAIYAQQPSRFSDPTQQERDLYDAIKRRFSDNSSYGTPAPGAAGDPRINVTEIMSIENNQKLIASKDCPPGSRVARVEIYASFQLVHWNPKSSDLAGEFGLKSVARSVTNNVKKIEYTFYVMFDPSLDESNRISRWDNAATFYHEMMHGQLQLNRIKDPNWSGWAEACRCNTPNPGFIGQGINSEAREHVLIGPAEDSFIERVVEARENLEVAVFNSTGITGNRDADGNRPFRHVITLTDAILNKGDINWTITHNNDTLDVDANLDRNNGTLVVTGKVSDDKTGRIRVFIDPPEDLMIMSVVFPPANPQLAEDPLLNVPGEEPAQWWLLLIPIPIVAAIVIYLKVRKKS